jgi:hypothetical protein
MHGMAEVVFFIANYKIGDVDHLKHATSLVPTNSARRNLASFA